MLLKLKRTFLMNRGIVQGKNNGLMHVLARANRNKGTKEQCERKKTMNAGKKKKNAALGYPVNAPSGLVLPAITPPFSPQCLVMDECRTSRSRRKTPLA